MSKWAAVKRQELRRSNAAVPHRNRYREFKRHGEPMGGVLLDEALGVVDAGEPSEESRCGED